MLRAFRAPVAKISPADETPWGDLELAAEDLEAGTAGAAVAYEMAWDNVLRDEPGPRTCPSAQAAHAFDARLKLPLASLADAGLESSSARDSQATPGTGSTKRAPSARRKREQRERARPRRRREGERFSSAGVSLAQRMAGGPATPRDAASPIRSGQPAAASPARPAPHNAALYDAAAASPERAAAPRTTGGLAARLHRAPAADGDDAAPREAHLAPSVGTLNAAVVDKQQRAEKRKEANKALRRKKRAEAALGTFAVGSAATLLAAH